MPIVLTASLVVCLAVAEPASLAVPSGMPKVLLVAPVNATWAANHADQWHAKGIDGFVFQGLVDGLAPDTRPKEDLERLTVEVRAAHARLSETGVDRSFLRLPLAPDAPYFAEAAAGRQGIAALRGAAELCRRTGLRGIVLDTRPESLIHQYRWDGYLLSETPPAVLHERARRFGRQAVRACLRAYPEGEIAVLADSFPPSGPLWYSLFEGMMQGPGAATDVTIHLLVGESAGVLDVPGDEVRGLAWLSKQLTARFGEAERTVWRRQGDIGLGLRPIRYRDGLPVPAYAIERFRARACVAKVLSGDYLWIDAPDGGWWRVGPETVGQYAHLAQRSAAAVLPTPPLPARYEDYTLRTPVDQLRRVGYRHGEQGEAQLVLRDERGAALLLPRGLPDGLEMTLRTGVLPVTNLYTGTRHEIPSVQDKAKIPTIEGPLLLERLPIAEYALPACLWMDAQRALKAGERRGEIRFGLDNRTAGPLKGTLEALSAEGYSLGTASFPVRLAPGERAAYTRVVQGIFKDADTPEFRLQFLLDGGGSTSRDFPVPVLPREAWSCFMDAPARAAPVAMRARDGSLWGMAAVSETGGLWFVDTGGAVNAIRLDDGPVHGIVVGTLADGTPRAAACLSGGQVRLYSETGEHAGQYALNHEGPPEEVIAMPGGPDDPDALLLSFADGSVESLPLDGSRGWRRGVSGIASNLTRADGDLVMSVNTSAVHRLVCMDAAGTVRWDHTLPSELSCQPALLPKPKASLAAVTRDGILRTYDLLSGKEIGPSGVKLGGARAIASMPGTEELLLVATGSSVFACKLGSTRKIWSKGIALPRLIGPLPGRGLVVADAYGALYVAHPEGITPWCNAPDHGTLTCPPVMIANETRGSASFLMAFADASVRLIEPEPFFLVSHAGAPGAPHFTLPDAEEAP